MITLRPLAPSDRGAFERFVGALSLESRLHRFLFPVRELAPTLLDRLTSPDQERHVAMGAFDGARLIGEGRYVRLGEGRRAEFAIAVADAWQRRGIGTRLLEVLLGSAHRARIDALEGEVLRTNAAMLGLTQRAGFRLASCPGDARITLVERMLAAA